MILRAPVRMLRWGLLALLLLASGGFAQSTTPQIDFDRWTRLAERAERVVDASRASTPALEEMRAQLVQSRTLFSAAETANSARITSLQAQLEVLGAAPEVVSAPEPVAEDPAGDGTSEGDALAQESTAPPEPAPVFTLVEPPEITARRDELVEQLVRAQAPGLRAQEAFRRAEGLIREIDAIIRDRQTEELLERGPTPLSYVAWGEALSALQSTATNIWSESSRLAISPMTGPNGDEGWLETLLFLLLAIVIVARGRHWVGLLTRWLARQAHCDLAGVARRNSCAVCWHSGVGGGPDRDGSFGGARQLHPRPSSVFRADLLFCTLAWWASFLGPHTVF
jgi:potassium efflux system protein